jgi:3-oxoacyl-(acyl-carrier-protein) synthase
MRLALEDAGVAPREIGVVYASANGTSLDDVEAAAIADVFQAATPVVTSVKGAIGECGASSSAACAAAFVCGAVGQAPPIASLCQPSTRATTLRLATSAMPVDGRTCPAAMITSGFEPL